MKLCCINKSTQAFLVGAVNESKLRFRDSASFMMSKTDAQQSPAASLDFAKASGGALLNREPALEEGK
jgi:hypothetical protein